jgi:phage terminase large subunit-like protein
MRGTPGEWATTTVRLFDRYAADRVVAETNNGGDLVEATLRTVRKNLPYRKVTATRGKRMRAEPVAALYEQHRVHHHGNLATLEDQMVTYTPDTLDSPDRLDALVWAATELTNKRLSDNTRLRAASGLK